MAVAKIGTLSIQYVLVTGESFDDPIFSQELEIGDDEDAVVDKWVAAVQAKFPTYTIQRIEKVTGIPLVDD